MRFKGLLIKTTKQGIYGKQEDEEEDLPYRMLERRNSNENNQIKVEPIYKIGVRNLMTNVYWDDAKFKEFID